MKSAPLALTLLLTAAACTPTYIEEKESLNFAPVFPEDSYTDSAARPTGGIYTASSGGIFASDRRAARVGDVAQHRLERRHGIFLCQVQFEIENTTALVAEAGQDPVARRGNGRRC